MGYRFTDVPALLRTPLGRQQVRGRIFYRAWPLLSLLARLYRASLAKKASVVAVVGSFGKTTTARAVSAALDRDPDALAENYFSFVAAAVLKIRPRDRHAVVEVGIDRPGQMACYPSLLRPQIAVVTSVGSAHNRYLPSLEVTRDEKAKMVRELRPTGIAVLNGDDENVLWMASQTQASVRTFGLEPGNDVRATDVAVDWPHGTRFTLHAGREKRQVRIRLLGRHMVYPALAAVTVALAEGLRLDDALARIEALPPTPGRMQPIRLSNGAFVLRDDFKSNMETMDAALDVLAEIPGRRTVILGDVEESPGRQGPTYARLGARLASVAARVVFVDAQHLSYATGARAGGLAPEALIDAGKNIARGIEVVRADLRAGDVVLIKGRSTQRLERVALALAGHSVRCELRSCDAMLTRCDGCPMLGRGWSG